VIITQKEVIESTSPSVVLRILVRYEYVTYRNDSDY